MASTCKRCGNTDPSHFAPHALKTKRMVCKTCMKAKRMMLRGDMNNNTARRILFNLKQKCRYQKRPEGALWTIEDVERLYKHYLNTKETPTQDPHLQTQSPRLRVVPIDKTKPMTIDNAKIVPFGIPR
jgi:hypothetical protein